MYICIRALRLHQPGRPPTVFLLQGIFQKNIYIHYIKQTSHNVRIKVTQIVIMIIHTHIGLYIHIHSYFLTMNLIQHNFGITSALAHSHRTK